ncbi:hydroxyproline O-galactosyltransferase GALT3-like [Lolium rigidum]|uniref:hydroxyproline O-galactosyltransferase GALT3-like n=1 Tax=Lolium rigidum TaxID=89674 RepID=UPI001F5D8612|nr:hydroxyproline O-galactosyltransferase GALT3-like [Lolium rigidum]XP_047060247.1 hydroxyproline O-galactosyltransferase GALT3-like [Lolium rigidum]
MRKCSGVIFILSLAALLFLLSPSPLTTHHPATTAAGPIAYILPSLPGLSGLYPPPTNSTSHLSWRLLRPILSRSDAIPGTAAGVLEAAHAWRNLTVAVAAAAAAAATRSNPEALDANCRASVDGDLRTRGVKIPCGLTEGAAVTVVGVPKQGAAGFRVEMVGGGGEVVACFNVSLGPAGMVVEQSSWTPEDGWGGWERCPPLGDIGSNTSWQLSPVDGLVRCNQQVGTNVIQGSNNTTQNVTDEKRPKGRAHFSGSFSIVEGEPFTATLWAGAEGFHMTVNGRHETSFTYRERLEPWSVAEVKVSGDLELLSILANGLPVSEDVDMASVELLKAPPLPKKRIFLLVGVFSTGNNFKRRMAMRRTWMQYESVRSGEVAVRFFTGLHKNEQVNMELWREAQLYGDIQLMPFVDYYTLITLKTIAICMFGTKIMPAKYIMKTDDDAFVRIDEVISSLKKRDPHGLLYGLISYQSSPHRNKDSKWFISPKEWPVEIYPPWAHGPGYVISRDIAKFVVRGHEERILQLFKLEDVAMGIWIQQYEDSGQKVNYANDERFYNEGCDTDYVLAHYQTPRLMMCLWEKLQMESQPVCCQ